MSKSKPRVFDNEYKLRFGLICLLAISIIMLSWTYKFKSNVIDSVNETNAEIFMGNFDRLSSSENGVFTELNLSAMGQRRMGPEPIDRTDYSINMGVFRNLPPVPEDWSAARYAFENGKYYILRAVEPAYYKQPEMYGDWDTLGIGYLKYGKRGCQNGYFATPGAQRISTKKGASVETYVLVRSSFCAGMPQSFKLNTSYPRNGITDDGIKYEQNPLVVKDYITVAYSPSGMVLGKSYPVFDADWVQKVRVTVDVADDTPSGIYVVSVGTDYYKPFLFFGNELNDQAYKSKGGSKLFDLILAVD